MNRLWINLNRNGGLGNRLFARAHVYAAAREFGATVLDWGLGDHASLFPAIARGRLPTYPLLPDGTAPDVPEKWWYEPRVLAALRQICPRRTGKFGPLWSCYWGSGDPETMALDKPAFRQFAEGRDVLYLDGYKLRCLDWTRAHAAEIRRYFAPPQALQAKWAHIQRAWHRQWKTTIGVHMRATDFKRAQGGRYYLSPAEYAERLRSDPQIDKAATLFVLFSDENFRDNAAFAVLSEAFRGLDHVLMRGDMADDLAGLASCDRIVGPISSTFSRWAAFAGDRPWAGVMRATAEDPMPALDFEPGIVPWDKV